MLKDFSLLCVENVSKWGEGAIGISWHAGRFLKGLS